MWMGENANVNDDRLRVDGDKNMRLLAFAITIVFVWTGPYCLQLFLLIFKFANQCTKYVIVFPTNKHLVGTLITMGGITVSIAIQLAKFTNHDTLSN